MQDQVADRIEKKLQELPWFDKVVTYTKPGFTAMNVGFRDNTPSRGGAAALLPAAQEARRYSRPNCPADLIGPNVNDEYGDVNSVLYMLTRRWRGLCAAEEGRRRHCASSSLRFRASRRLTCTACRTSASYVEFSHAKLATLGIPPEALFASLQKQNAVLPAGTVESGAQRIAASHHGCPRRGEGGSRNAGRGARAACSVLATSRR